VLWNQDGADPQQCPSTPGSEVEQLSSTGLGQPVGLGADNPLLLSSNEPLNQGVQLLPSGGTLSDPHTYFLISAFEQRMFLFCTRRIECATRIVLGDPLVSFFLCFLLW
jgi:hypothetical protein